MPITVVEEKCISCISYELLQILARNVLLEIFFQIIDFLQDSCKYLARNALPGRIEMHVLLLFIQIVLNTYDLEWQKFVQLEGGKTRMKEIRVFKTRKYFKQKQASDFWMRGVYLANLFGNYFGTNVNELQSPKTMISNVYFMYFEKSFDPENVCTWRLSCLCTDCTNIRKLDFATKDLGN